jgi:hypothetical protein
MISADTPIEAALEPVKLFEGIRQGGSSPSVADDL